MATCVLYENCEKRRKRQAAENDEGVPWNWGDPDSPGYRLDMTRAQRIQAAAAWRAAHGESE